MRTRKFRAVCAASALGAATVAALAAAPAASASTLSASTASARSVTPDATSGSDCEVGVYTGLLSLDVIAYGTVSANGKTCVPYVGLLGGFLSPVLGTVNGVLACGTDVPVWLPPLGNLVELYVNCPD